MEKREAWNKSKIQIKEGGKCSIRPPTTASFLAHDISTVDVFFPPSPGFLIF